MKKAFVFPGQGSQKVGMLAEFYQEGSVFKETFDQAERALDYDVWNLIQQGPQEELNMTEKTQPALVASSVALWRTWCEKSGALPDYMSGHSLGEWSALVCSGVIDYQDALKIVRLRGKYMQEAVPAGVGAMAAIIGLADDIVENVCAESSGEDSIVTPVNYNSPGQLVIAGVADAVERAMAGCKEAGAKRALLLPVSAPFHTELMKPAADQLAAHLTNIELKAPAIPIVHNVHAKIEHDPQAIKALMIEQIYSPVKWVDCVKTLVRSDVELAIECGPGKVLGGLCKRIHKPLSVSNIDSTSSLDDAVNN